MTNAVTLDRNVVNRLNSEQFRSLLRANPGLILGPSWISGKGTFSELTAALSQEPPQDVDTPYFAVITRRTRDSSLSLADAEQILRRHFSGQLLERSKRAAKVRWGAVLSCCLNNDFEHDFREQRANRPGGAGVIIANELGRILPPRTVPAFKLLGSFESNDVVLTESTFKIRTSTWPQAVKTFMDHVKAAPIVCLGMSDCKWGMTELLAAMMASPMTQPRALVFLEDDALLTDQLILELTRGRTSLVSVATSPNELLTIADASDLAKQTTIPFADSSDPIALALRSHRDLLVLVNEQLETPISSAEEHTLQELLFSPSVARWDPFVHNMDFRRAFEKSFLDDLRSILGVPDPGSASVIIRGAAAIGKTTFSKRIALELARQGNAVIWLRPWFFQDGSRAVGDAFRELAKLGKAMPRQVVVFMDDPLSFGGVLPADVAAQAEAVGIRVLLISVVRSSDWASIPDHALFTGSLPILTEFDVPESLEDEERLRLAKYLVRLKAYENEAAAKEALTGIRSSRDTLSVLYWHLPMTRQKIAHSIKDEYFRLGDMAGLTRVLIGAYEASSAFLKKAYELVAVADRYRSPVPVEVLVSTLEVGYDEWTSAFGSESAFGLLYPDESSTEGTSYRTRNSIVTDTLTNLINMGRFAHAGEVAVLQDLLSSCRGSSPVYREFCIRVLVPHSKLEHLEYERGLNLYNIAIAALPVPERVLLHHKGLWIKNRGRDPLMAKEVLQQALETPPYPYASKGDVEQHIYTSLAATELDALTAGKVDRTEGTATILRYLERARSETFFNPSAVHVEAGLIYRLLRATSVSTADSLNLVNNALTRIDRTVLVLLNQPITTLHVAQDLEYLGKARENILSNVASPQSIDTLAEDLWREGRRQDGFVIAARARYKSAMDSSKGSDFNEAHSYCTKVFELIRNAHDVVSVSLTEVALQIYYHWRILRVSRGDSAGGQVDWNYLRELSQTVLRNLALANEAFYRYICGLAQYHLGETGAASSIFEGLRRQPIPNRVLFAPRDYLLSPDGMPRPLQGKIRAVAGSKLIYCEELQADFYLARSESWPRDGELETFYVKFALAGPVAVHR